MLLLFFFIYVLLVCSTELITLVGRTTKSGASALSCEGHSGDTNGGDLPRPKHACIVVSLDSSIRSDQDMHVWSTKYSNPISPQ
jgi:hypothetical protein